MCARGQGSAFERWLGSRDAEALRAAGFSAFTETVNTDKGKLTRVRAGPVIDRAAADAQFAAFADAVRAAPRDWRARYRLSLAYAAAGDRTRARAAAREAVRLHRAR